VSALRTSHVGPRDWDAEVYHRVSDPQFEWAKEVLARLDLRGDEVVLDAGCGSGRVTALLAERVPDGRVIGIDASESMVAKARETLGDDVELHIGDLTELELAGEVDVVFSNAVFHWIRDHDALFARLHRALRPGGRLVAQCGGEGNVAAVAEAIAEVGAREPFARQLEGFEPIWNFSSAEDAQRRLRSAGFEDVECWLERKPVTPEDPFDYVTTSALGPITALLPDSDAHAFAEAVVEGLGTPLTLEYVRLNILARRPPR
jgi:trans-aconitate 2-methyltransferase